MTIAGAVFAVVGLVAVIWVLWMRRRGIRAGRPEIAFIDTFSQARIFTPSIRDIADPAPEFRRHGGWHNDERKFAGAG
jgi:uncharacterized membrane protein YqiK